MRTWLLTLLLLVILPVRIAHAQGTVPIFRQTAGSASYAVPGAAPANVTTTIPVMLAPLILSFDAKKIDGKPFVSDSRADVAHVLRSPIFTDFPFPTGGHTQYADAMLRSTFTAHKDWHTLLGKPEVKPIQITIPLGFGYILTSRASGRSLAVVDIVFLQKEIFKQIPKQAGSLVIAVAHNATFYSHGDATECCAWGTHGVDSSTGSSFVLASYLNAAPSVVKDRDIQPLTQQLAQFFKDPLFDPLMRGRNAVIPGNVVPGWLRPAWQSAGDQGPCGGDRVGTDLFLLEPVNTNLKNTLPVSKPFVARTGKEDWHLQTVALLPWYTGAFEGWGSTYSFPDSQALTEHAQPCPPPAPLDAPPMPNVSAIPQAGLPNGHKMIGYWIAYGPAGAHIPLREVSPQWDIIIVAFATPDPTAPEGTMQFGTPVGMDTEQFKADIAYMKSQGKKVIVSLGGGGQNFTLNDPKRVPTYVASVARIVTEYGFDGIDIDFESPSLSIDPGDKDFRRPTTPSIVNLISALRQLHDRFGPDFMISLVPEGT